MIWYLLVTGLLVIFHCQEITKDVQGSIFCFLFCMEKRSNKPNNVMTTSYVKQLIVASEFGLIKGVLIASPFVLMVDYLHFETQL